ncbi:MAG: tetratricopeptide repeat protein [Candidatus Micrarchaeota archaeon]
METPDRAGREENPQNPELDSESAEYHKLYYFPAIMFTEEMAPVRQFEEAGDYRKALETLEGVIEKQPDQPQYLNHKASLLTRMGRMEEAKELLLKIIGRYPDNVTAREYLAMTYTRTGNYDMAEKEFLGILRMKESNAFANYMMGVLKFKHGHREANIRRAAQAAVGYFERASELRPDLANTYSFGHYEFVIAYAWAGRMEKAIGLMDECIRKKPETEHYLTANLAGIAMQQQQFWKAIELQTRAIGLEPTNAMNYNERGRAYSYLHQYAFALDEYDKAIELDPNQIYARQNRGRLLVWMRSWDRALEDLNFVLGRWPNYLGYYNRAILRLQTGELDMAQEDIAKARELSVSGKQRSQLDELEASIRKRKNAMSGDIVEIQINGHRARETLREVVRHNKMTRKERKDIGAGWHGPAERERQKNNKPWRGKDGRYAQYY